MYYRLAVLGSIIHIYKTKIKSIKLKYGSYLQAFVVSPLLSGQSQLGVPPLPTINLVY